MGETGAPPPSPPEGAGLSAADCALLACVGREATAAGPAIADRYPEFARLCARLEGRAERAGAGTAEALARQNQELQRQVEELSRRLNETLGRLAARTAGANALVSPGAAPQHDRLVQAFRQLKVQDFQAVSAALYGCRKAPTAGPEGDRALALARLRKILADEVLLKGGSLLGVLLGVRQQLRAEIQPAQVRAAVYQSVCAALKISANGRARMPAELRQGLVEAIDRGLELIRALRSAVPPGSLLVPKEGSAFVPEQHEALLGCPTQAGVRVRLTVFPGYLVAGAERVLEKALVYTAAGK